ncbi:hypothetical protein [Paucibacter sp. DJ2R-2]|uniref:hypothetical protein n=1 Tax=Paucibacter sp. DJ2R-2 TaxID=2893558 RepID=UPI0021E43F5C|nr:hypothetical protein [Paucibacter sp. DJ2R-2]MCV2441274.1 hypothetical protein [Paucibacter sp. DJ2R-2]
MAPDEPFERELRGQEELAAARKSEEEGGACGGDYSNAGIHRVLKVGLVMQNRTEESFTLRPVALLRLLDGQGRTADLTLHATESGQVPDYPRGRPDQFRADAGRVTALVFASDDVCRLPLDARALVTQLLDGAVKGKVYTIDYAGRSFASAFHAAHKDGNIPSPDAEALDRLSKFANGAKPSGWAWLYEYLR